MGFVGRFDVHKGHGGGLALLILVVVEDFYALDATKPFKVLLDSVLPYVLREVTHPKMSGLADHSVRVVITGFFEAEAGIAVASQ